MKGAFMRVMVRRGITPRDNTARGRISRTGVVAVLAATTLAVAGAITAAATSASAASSPRQAGGASHGGLAISKQSFGATVEPYTGESTPTYRYTLTNARGV